MRLAQRMLGLFLGAALTSLAPSHHAWLRTPMPKKPRRGIKPAPTTIRQAARQGGHPVRVKHPERYLNASARRG